MVRIVFCLTAHLHFFPFHTCDIACGVERGNVSPPPVSFILLCAPIPSAAAAASPIMLGHQEWKEAPPSLPSLPSSDASSIKLLIRPLLGPVGIHPLCLPPQLLRLLTFGGRNSQMGIVLEWALLV